MEGLINLVTDSNNRPRVPFMYKQSRNTRRGASLNGVYPRCSHFSHRSPEDVFTVMDESDKSLLLDGSLCPCCCGQMSYKYSVSTQCLDLFVGIGLQTWLHCRDGLN